LLYARLLLCYLADHVYVAELANGARVLDASDFSQWCRELAEEARKIGKLSDSTEPSSALELRAGTSTTSPAPQKRWKSRACPDCDHEHEGREECGFYLGEERFCHCPSKADA
jgi:hypothetical protein